MSQNPQGYNPYHAQQLANAQTSQNAMYMQQQQQPHNVAQPARANVYPSPGHPHTHSPHASPTMYATAAPGQVIPSAHLVRPGVIIPPHGAHATTYAASSPNSAAVARHAASPSATGRGVHPTGQTIATGPYTTNNPQAQAQQQGRAAAGSSGAAPTPAAAQTGRDRAGEAAAADKPGSSSLLALPAAASLQHLTQLKEATATLCHAVVSTLLTESDLAAHSTEFTQALIEQKHLDTQRGDAAAEAKRDSMTDDSSLAAQSSQAQEDFTASLGKISLSQPTFPPQTLAITQALQQIQVVHDTLATSQSRVSDTSLTAARDFLAFYTLPPSKPNIPALVLHSNGTQVMGTMPDASVTVAQRLIISTPTVVSDTHTDIPVHEHEAAVLLARARAAAELAAESSRSMASDAGSIASDVSIHLPPLQTAPFTLTAADLKTYGLYKIAEMSKSPATAVAAAGSTAQRGFPAQTQPQMALVHNVSQHARSTFQKYLNQYQPSLAELQERHHNANVDRFNTAPKLSRVMPSVANGWSETEAARLVNQVETKGQETGTHHLPTLFEKSTAAICKKASAVPPHTPHCPSLEQIGLLTPLPSNSTQNSETHALVAADVVAAAASISIAAMLRILHPNSFATVVYVPEKAVSSNQIKGNPDTSLEHACATAVLPPIVPSILHCNFRYGYMATLLQSLSVKNMKIAGVIVTVPMQRSVLIPISARLTQPSSLPSHQASSHTIPVNSSTITPLSLASSHASLKTPIVFGADEDPLIFLRAGMASTVYSARLLTEHAKRLYNRWTLQGKSRMLPPQLITDASSLWLRTLAYLRKDMLYITLISHMIFAASAVLPKPRNCISKPRKITNPLLQLRRPELCAYSGDAGMRERLARVRAALGGPLVHEMSGQVLLELETAARGV